MDVTDDNLKDALSKLIVMENLPFSFVESQHLIDVLALFDERIRKKKFPMADTIAGHVLTKYQAAKAHLKNQLSDVASINLTIDLSQLAKG